MAKSNNDLLEEIAANQNDDDSGRIYGDGGIFGENNTNTPVSVTEDGELMVAQTPQERNHYFGLKLTDVAATAHRMLIDLSDTTNYPHDSTGRIDLSALYLQVDRDTSATGVIRVGVITRVNATNADVVYSNGLQFTKSDDRHINRDRNFSPSQLKLDVVNGNAVHLAVPKSTNIAAINTTTGLVDLYGATKTPAVGDVVFSCDRTAGTYDATAAGFYHSEVL